MGRKWDKFWLLMWKNFLLQWRHPIQTVIEICAPVLFTAILVILRSLVSPEEHPASFYLPFETKLTNISTLRTTVMWSPVNPNLDKIMTDTIDGINKVHNVTVFNHKSFNNSDLLMQELIGNFTAPKLFAGIIFDDNYSGDVELMPNISVIFRFPGEVGGYGNWKTDDIFPVYYTPGVRSPVLNDGGLPSYHAEGFLMLQEQLSLSFINHYKQAVHNIPFDRWSVPISMQRFPYPKYTTDFLLSALDIFIGMVFMLSFVYPCINTVKMITTEKEKQLKEAMKIMGLPNWLHWTAWFLKSFILIFISLIIMVTLLKASWYPGTDYTVFTRSNPFILLIFFILFTCATITFSFAISAFFTKANTSATFAGVAWFMSYAPYMAFQFKYDSLSLAEKMLASLCSNSALAYGMKLIIKMESTEQGLQWNTIWNPIQEDNMLLGHVLIMLAADTVLYFFIAIYVEAVFPGDFGVAQPWYFLFSPSFWCGKKVYVVDNEMDEKRSINENYETEPTHLQPGIKIKHLRKVYSNKKIAVRDLSMNMYQDQITVLLGHNGAGKTTVMSMLIGMISPTSGTAIVGGHDITTNIDGVRNSLGICPQHNILFDELTVEEHLYFYSRLKGVPKSKVSMEIDKYLQLLELTQKAKSHSASLSGGMKRKLSVGVALCGDSKVVMCDEPTAGMDPSARRALWDLLLSQKKDRTILLTTHFMDEADLLGDRIAIMAGGKLECSGSSFFLKKRYGAGYHLIMDKSPDCNVANITELLRKYIPNITVSGNIGSELTYVLSKEHSTVFEQMLKEFEEKSTSLGVRSYGVSLTTLEEVFMKVGADHGQEEINNAFEQTDDLLGGNDQNNETQLDLNMPEYHYLSGFALWRNQIRAMFMKKVISTYRSWILLIIQNLIPIVFLVLTLIIITNFQGSSDLPMIRIRLNRYIDPITTISRISNDNYSENYINMLKESNYTVLNWENVSERVFNAKMINESEKDILNYNTRYITGASFNENNSVIAWFSNQPYHGAPLALQLAINGILRTETTPNHNITMYNYPLPYTLDTKFSKLYKIDNLGFQIAFNLGFGMAFVSAFYIMFYIRERSTKFKHLQFVSGVDVLSFWIPSFICDIATFLITCVCIIATLAIAQEEGLSTAIELSRIFALLLAFLFGFMPITYLASFFFNTPSSGYTKIALINILLGTGTFMIVEILTINGIDLEHVSLILHQIFLIVPHYCLNTGLRDMSVLHTSQQLCRAANDTCINFHIPQLPNFNLTPAICKWIICHQYKECCEELSYFSFKKPGMGQQLVFCCSIGAIFFVILLLLEYGFFEEISNKFRRHYPYLKVESDEDENVIAEKRMIMHDVSIGNTRKYNLVMHNLSKNYGKLLAVDNLSLGIHKYECFGLLGINGAGKTTTFKMITGDIRISMGDAWVNGWSIKKNIKKVFKLIGYCPQFDALLDDLTCRETLTIFGLLRGVSKKQCNYLAENLAKQFDFSRHLNKKVKELSGGNKRKLSTALALVGDPLVLYLDEPTAGVDPATKRYLWNVLCKVRDTGKAIVLTSHSMEECEALCTKLAIMVNGSFKCLGSTQHLKSKFSDGYTLTIKVKQLENDELQESKFQEIEKFIKQNFEKSTLRERHQELLTFYIADKTQPWSKMFGRMENAKTSLCIEDYSLGQCSLEQVFLMFAKHQRDE